MACIGPWRGHVGGTQNWDSVQAASGPNSPEHCAEPAAGILAKGPGRPPVLVPRAGVAACEAGAWAGAGSRRQLRRCGAVRLAWSPRALAMGCTAPARAPIPAELARPRGPPANSAPPATGQVPLCGTWTPPMLTHTSARCCGMRPVARTNGHQLPRCRWPGTHGHGPRRWPAGTTGRTRQDSGNPALDGPKACGIDPRGQRVGQGSFRIPVATASPQPGNACPRYG
jgi:hypothetical protein